MATKMCFFTHDDKAFEEKIITFTYVKGMAFSQKQKNVISFHGSIQSAYPQHRILEVSTKSLNPLGVKLSAFNLKLDGFPLESVFQSSKVFANGTQYTFLKSYAPRDAKKFISENATMPLSSFRYNDAEFPLIPQSMFYDYIYIKALMAIPEISMALKDYDIFTDIEFNEKKQINCQARACAIYAHMLRTNSVDFFMSSLSNFKTLYLPKEEKQLSFFDII